MQIVIDIPDTHNFKEDAKIAYELIKDREDIPFGTIGFLHLMKDVSKNGIPIPDNATNGDIIKAMFQNIESIDAPLMKVYVMVYTKDHKCMRFDSDWWNAPYERD